MLVVGAGPAGSVTALLLARAGIDVTVVDRATFPRAKPCGDCLSAEATRLLARLGLLDDVLALAPARLIGWRIRGPHGTGFAARFDDVQPGAMALALPRAVLDNALLDAARAAGARVLPGTAITDLVFERGHVRGVRLRDGSELRAACTVGADGLRSRVARRLHALARPPRLRKLSLTAHVALERHPDGFGEMHVGDGLCAGIAPVSLHGTWNVTVVADARRFGRAAALDPHAFCAFALAALGIHDAAARMHGSDLLASGPFDAPMRQVAFDGAALVGDAAGYYDPFTGQGVYQAIAGATLLAPLLAGILGAGREPDRAALAPWTLAHRALARGPRRVQHLVELALGRPDRAAFALRAVAARPRLARTLLAVTGDLLPAGALLSPHNWLAPRTGDAA